MIRTLVNLNSPCEGAVNPCATPSPSVTEEIVYGADGLPGAIGEPGTPGANGRNAFSTTSSAFVMPPVGALAAVQVQDNRSFTVGQLVYIAQVGYFQLASKVSFTGLQLENLGGTSTMPVGALIGSGLRVTSGAQPGPDTPGNTPKRYAIIAQMEDMGDDGGPLFVQYGTGSTAGGMGVVSHLEKILDEDSIVTISGSSNFQFSLPVGSWKINVRAPSYNSKAFQVYLVRSPEFNLISALDERLATGNGYAPIIAGGLGAQENADVSAIVAVSGLIYFKIQVRQQSWSFGRAATARNRALGVGSNFDDGAAVPVREIFTLVEIEEL